MTLGEEITHEGGGVVIGNDTGRVIAKFSHESEAESFCNLVTENEKLAKTIKQYEEALPALVEENKQLRTKIEEMKEDAKQRLGHEWAIDDDNKRLIETRQ